MDLTKQDKILILTILFITVLSFLSILVYLIKTITKIFT